MSKNTAGQHGAASRSGSSNVPPQRPVLWAYAARSEAVAPTWTLAIDPSSHRIYTANLHDATVPVINGPTCNGRYHGGYGKASVRDAVGSYPEAIAADPGAGTVYVVNLDSSVSVLTA